MAKEETVNTHDQLRKAGGGVAITRNYTGTRTQYFYGWAVYRVDGNGKAVVTDPKAHWSDYGRKVFSASSETGSSAERSRKALETTKKWIADQGWYEGEWARNRMRDYVPKDINKRFPLRKD